MEERFLDWWESLTTPVSLVIVGAGFLGLLVGWLVGRRPGERQEQEAPDSGAFPEAGPEWRWRHEKLVLVERQDAERRERLDRFLDAVCDEGAPGETAIRARLFALGEVVRTSRRRIGTDLSRLGLAGQRFDALGGEIRPGVVSACREIAESQAARLEAARDGLREIAVMVSELEGRFLTAPIRSEGDHAELRRAAESIEAMLATMPGDWHELTDEADRKIRELLASEGSPALEPIREVLFLDGAYTASLRPPVSHSIGEGLQGLREALVSAQTLEERPRESVDPSPTVPVKPLPTDLTPAPQTDVRLPEVPPSTPVSEPIGEGATRPIAPLPALGRASAEAGREESPTSEGAAPVEDCLVVFRSNEVGLWGQEVYRGANCRARALGSVPEWAQWVSLRRVDTGERVLAPMSASTFGNGDTEVSAGFNGSNERFYGANHLGMFADSCPNEVETRFTYGGWGFGHRVRDMDAVSESLQASGWAGQEIDPDTVFEIALHAELPELGESDRVLEPS